MGENKFKIIKKNSTIGRNRHTLKMMSAVGFKPNSKIGAFVVHNETPQILGIVKRLQHVLIFEKI